MSETEITMRFEDLPNEILVECFEYFNTSELFHSFGQLNRRFNQLIRTLPLHLNFQDVEREIYDVLCEQMLTNPDAQERVYSLRLSNRNTPGQIEDFLSKFALNQFYHLRSVTFIDIQENNLQSLQQNLPFLSQVTTLHLLDSETKLIELESFLPMDNLQTLSFNSNMAFVQQTILIKSLILSTISLNEMCCLYQYTPFLQYLNVSCVRAGVLNSIYHKSPRPNDLKDLILTDFRPLFVDLTHFLQNKSSVRNFTFSSSSDMSMLDAPRWERLIKSSLLDLKNFRFKLAVDHRLNQHNVCKIFDRFQRNFWLCEHQWLTKCLANKQSIMIFTIPYLTECRQIPLVSKSYSNPQVDYSQTFNQLHKLVVSAGDLFEHANYQFSNITSLSITHAPNLSSESDEERVFESLTKLMNFSQLNHLEFPLDCQSGRPSLLFQILDLAPQLTSLRTKPCLLESLLNQPGAHRYLNSKIRKLDLSNYSSHQCTTPVRIRSLYQLIPNLEQLTMSITDINDLFFLVDQFPKLSSFTVHFTSKDRPQPLDVFIKQALERKALIHEIAIARRKFVLTLGVWMRKNKSTS